MGIDRNFIQRLLRELETHCLLLKGARDSDLQEDPLRALGVQHALQICIEAMLNISHHLLAQTNRPPAERNVDAVTHLVKWGIITDPQLIEHLPRMVRFRNLLVHRYWQVNPETVSEVIHNHLGDFDRFTQQIESFLEKNPSL